MKRLAALTCLAMVVAGCADSAPPTILDHPARYGEPVALPLPDTKGSVPLEEVISNRRSTRNYADTPLTIEQIGQLLWAGQGITDERRGYRAAPSAGALYPLELYVITADEVLHYRPEDHSVRTRADSRVATELRAAAFDQPAVERAPAVIAIAAVESRTEAKYGGIGGRLVDREAGHAAQNILLQAVALDLVAVPIGGLDPPLVEDLLALPPDHEVLYLIPVGSPGLTSSAPRPGWRAMILHGRRPTTDGAGLA
ncbi:MAG: SagB/ThcOx family dehydrogenase [Actinomycetia bacterium]|nr:SagB/ThcOx family dehydrogenase [Actinomycetes bacterium]